MRISDWSSDVCSSDLPLGTKAFDEIATTSFDDFHGRIGGNDERCWDPILDVEPGTLEYASNAPDITIAAMIERNLLFADRASLPEQRLDRILEQDRKRTRLTSRHYCAYRLQSSA